MAPIRHPVYALTTYELNARRSALERAVTEIPQATPVPDALRNDLNDVITEQEQRTRIRQVNRRDDGQDHYCVRQQTTAAFERTKRELQANLGLVTTDSRRVCPSRLICEQLTLNSPIALTAIMSAG